jgi:hypothetical protein
MTQNFRKDFCFPFQNITPSGDAFVTNLPLLVWWQDTLKSPPSEHKTMKKAAMYGIGATTVFYISVGCAGYAAFGSDAPGNILTASGLGPFWLVDIANMCLILHLIGAYQVSASQLESQNCINHKSDKHSELHEVNLAALLSISLS